MRSVDNFRSELHSLVMGGVGGEVRGTSFAFELALTRLEILLDAGLTRFQCGVMLFVVASN